MLLEQFIFSQSWELENVHNSLTFFTQGLCSFEYFFSGASQDAQTVPAPFVFKLQVKQIANDCKYCTITWFASF
jgi:hypothetical protein